MYVWEFLPRLRPQLVTRFPFGLVLCTEVNQVPLFYAREAHCDSNNNRGHDHITSSFVELISMSIPFFLDWTLTINTHGRIWPNRTKPLKRSIRTDSRQKKGDTETKLVLIAYLSCTTYHNNFFAFKKKRWMSWSNAIHRKSIEHELYINVDPCVLTASQPIID